MKIGTRSLIFGVHNVLWHPITVLLAWRKLYGWPNWRELICIIVHDWGYWGKPNMDGEEGERHPEVAARWMSKMFGTEYGALCLWHSRHYARQFGVEPSRLCWADKLSIRYERWWLYLPRAWMSGELQEYRKNAANAGLVPITASHREWFAVVQQRMSVVGTTQQANAMCFVNPQRRAS